MTQRAVVLSKKLSTVIGGGKMIDKTFQTAKKALWAWRDNNDWFATPDEANSMRYAASEAGEFIAAYIKTLRPNDVNNPNSTRDNMVSEAADCIVMIMSSLPRDAELCFTKQEREDKTMSVTPDEIVMSAFKTFIEYKKGGTSWHSQAALTLKLFDLWGVDPIMAVDVFIGKIERRKPNVRKEISD